MIRSAYLQWNLNLSEQSVIYYRSIGQTLAGVHYLECMACIERFRGTRVVFHKVRYVLHLYFHYYVVTLV